MGGGGVVHDLLHIMKKSFGLVIDSIHKIDRIGCSVSTSTSQIRS
jgi:hypothetical protein